MTPAIVFIGGLITWRISIILHRENGPLHVFARFRAVLAKRQTKQGGLFDLMSCSACISVFVGAMTSVAFADDVFEWLGYTFAFSAVSVILEALIAKK